MQTERTNDLTVVIMDADYNPFDEEALAAAQRKLYDLVEKEAHPTLVLDLSATEYFGSSFIEMLVRVWNRLRQRDGRLALCGLNENCREVIRVSRLDTLWPVYDTRDEALHEFAGAGDH